MKLLLLLFGLTTITGCSMSEANRDRLHSAEIGAGKAVLRLGVGYLNARYGAPQFRNRPVELRGYSK